MHTRAFVSSLVFFFEQSVSFVRVSLICKDRSFKEEISVLDE